MKEATIRSTHPERGGRYQVQSSGDRVWVNGPDGASVARISKHGGIDVHRLIEVNDAFALGCYGLDPVIYAKMISARWEELTGPEFEQRKHTMALL